MTDHRAPSWRKGASVSRRATQRLSALGAGSPTITIHGVKQLHGAQHEVIPYRSGVLPIMYLSRFFRMNEKSANSFHVFVTGSDSSPVGIAVDRIAGQREIVVRLIEDSLVRVPGIAGVTELGDGRPVLILDVAAIVDAASPNLAPELHIQS